MKKKKKNLIPITDATVRTLYFSVVIYVVVAFNNGQVCGWVNLEPNCSFLPQK